MKKYRKVNNPGDLLVAMCSGEPVIYNGVLWQTVDMGISAKDKIPKSTGKRTKRKRK